MNDDQRVAVAISLLVFSGLVSLVTTGAVTIPPRQATDLRTRRWRWAPMTLLAANVAASVVLPWWPSRLICFAAGVLAAVALAARPDIEVSTPLSGRRVAASRDSHLVRRTVLVYASVLVSALGVYTAMLAAQG